jgi:hypothetical protein
VIVAVSPPGTIGETVAITVTVRTLTSIAIGPNQFIYGPVVADISPASGFASGGTSVTITRSGFAPGATVKFGSVQVQAANVNVVSDTEITAVSPPGTVIVNVSVTVGTLTSIATGPDRFKYN